MQAAAGFSGNLFQSTLPQGERPDVVVCGGYNDDFNPRSRKGSDIIFNIAVLRAIISIHAPARGATATGRE